MDGCAVFRLDKAVSTQSIARCKTELFTPSNNMSYDDEGFLLAFHLIGSFFFNTNKTIIITKDKRKAHTVFTEQPHII
jgi:hypothetical protein